MERRNAWLSYTEAEEKELEKAAKAYRNFLNCRQDRTRMRDTDRERSPRSRL